MRKYYLIVIIVVIGFAFAALALFLIERSPEPSQITTTGSRGFVSFFGRQFGFTSEDDEQSPDTGTTTPEIRPTFRQRLALEKMISVSPEIISGITFTASTTVATTTSGILATTTIESARYVLRETGNIYDLSLETGDTKRLTNTTVPRVQEASFGVNGSAIALRYLANDNETIETFVAPLSTNPFATTSELSGRFLPQNIASLSWSPSTSQLFYLTTTGGGATGRIASVLGTNTRTIFFSPLSEWIATWTTPGKVFLTMKPSYRALGSGVFATIDGAESTVFRGSPGLTALSNPSGNRVLYTTANGNRVRTFIYDLVSRESTEFLVPTLPEKCVWADDERVLCAIPERVATTVPDSWYQGAVSFDDSFWLLNSSTGQVDFLFDPEETSAHTSVDATNLSLSYNNTVLSFINKKDVRGWVADLSEWF